MRPVSWSRASAAAFTMYQPYLDYFMNQSGQKNVFTKGQIKPKADWRAIDSPKKRTNEFVFFCHEKQKKTNSFVRFLGQSTARQSAYGFI